MSLRVLITCPTNSKLFVDLIASAHFVRTLHPTLELDILVSPTAIPSWWSNTQSWLRILSNTNECTNNYDLIIQTTPEKLLAEELNRLQSENRTGVLLAPQLCVVGRWSQTLVAQIGSRRFSPFTPFDLFNNILLGKTALRFNYPSLNTAGQWIIDLDSLPIDKKTWGEALISQISLTHPGRVLDKISAKINASNVTCYVGANEAAFSWFSFHGSHCALVLSQSFSPQLAPANPKGWIIPADYLPTPTELISMFNSNDQIFGECFRHTNEFLGGNIAAIGPDTIDDSAIVFERLNYVAFNYLNDLAEIDIPIPEVSANCCMRLKGAKTVCDKIIHLNLFAIKFLQEFLDKDKETTIRENDINDLTTKINEIDTLSDKTLLSYPELDLIRLVSHFAKSSAQGENIIEISKSLILVYHEMNQALSAINELTQLVIDRHNQKASTATT